VPDLVEGHHSLEKVLVVELEELEELEVLEELHN
jgi:hypothetical protein